MKHLLEIISFLNFTWELQTYMNNSIFPQKKKSIDKWKEYTIKVKQLYSCYKYDTSWMQ